MDQTQLRYLLALWLIPQIGPVIQETILQQFPKLTDFFNLSSKELIHIGFKQEVVNRIKQVDWTSVDAILNWAELPDHHLITFDQDCYPLQLKQIRSAPLILLAKGNIELLNLPQIAIVGSRNPTHAGLLIAKEYASFLANQGLVITSGLALGIDAMAHQGALNATGKTIAVMGTGPDVIYPKKHSNLANAIMESGLLLSEFSLGTLAQKLNFPRRNRIISGLSLGTFVVEASMRSGSLITARFALEQGREVFAMPSSIHNPMAKGCHWLIKQGANLIDSVEDIWQQIQQHMLKNDKNQRVIHGEQINRTLDFSLVEPHISNTLTTDQQQLLELIGFDRISVQALSEQTNFTFERLSVVLLELELLGLIIAVPGGFERISKRT